MTASSKLTFPGSRGTALAGRLEMPPDRPPRAWALFAHCFTCGKDVVAAGRISRALAEAGIAVLRFDFTGLGHSSGDFANSDFSSNVEDLVCAADYLRTHHQAPSLLVGHSLGGAAVLAVAHQIPDVRAVATLGAPADPAHVTRLLEGSRADIETRGEADVVLAGRRFRIRKQFLADIAAQPQRVRIRELNAALLVMHSAVDDIVGVDNARQIFDAARHPKSFIAVDGADHLLTRPADARYVAAVLAAWAGRYTREPEPEAAESRLPAEGVVEVAENGAGRFGQQIAVGRHRLTADEPTPIGQDSGPTPYDLLLAGLGACTSMTVRMYADRKRWPLEQVSVVLSHSRIHAEDCVDCETTTGKVDRIERWVKLSGGIDHDQRRRCWRSPTTVRCTARCAPTSASRPPR